MNPSIKGGSLADWYRQGVLKHLYRLNDTVRFKAIKSMGLGAVS